MTTRRTLLRVLAVGTAGAAATAAAGAVTGAWGPAARRTQVAVVWSGGELDAFHDVLGEYEQQERPPQRVDAVSAGDNIDAFLRARQRTGARPDVAVLSRPGLISGYARRGWLSALEDEWVAGQFGPPWSDLVRHENRVYGTWVKAAHKSLLWYLPSVLREPPRTWEDLIRTVRRLAGTADRTGVAPLAIGAADGWVLTDWFENVLAATATRDFEDELVHRERSWTDQQVRNVLDLLAQVWSVPDAFPGGGRRALLTQFDESVIQAATGRAAMLVGADFVARVASGYLADAGNTLDWEHFPEITRVPLVVGGDAAVVLRGSQAGADLVRWLAQPSAFTSWIRRGTGYLSPHPRAPLHEYPDSSTRDIAGQLIRSSAEIRFDLSDRLPGLFTGADGVGIWRILQEFFATVTTPGAEVTAAVNRAARQLDQAAREAARDGGGL